ncbi:MAG: PDZ domain-containing protein [Acidobacteriota bacterium]
MRSIAAVMVSLWLMALSPRPVLAAEQAFRCTKDVQVCLNELVSTLKKRGWLGIEYDDSMGGKPLRIYRVVPGSPAEAAGLIAGDVLVAMDGLRLDNPALRDKISERRSKQVPGDNVQYSVLRAGKERVFTITLGALPSDIMAQWIGMHMLEHAQIDPTN